jgi:hypothetical protein
MTTNNNLLNFENKMFFCIFSWRNAKKFSLAVSIISSLFGRTIKLKICLALMRILSSGSYEPPLMDIASINLF